MAYQFIHIEAVSRAGRDLYTNRNGKRFKIGQISVDSVLKEAGRFEGFISHIESPLNPVILYGDKEKSIEDVQQKINDWVDGTTDARGHKVRKDALCLLSSMISWPPIEDTEDEKEYIKKMKAFESAMLIWLKRKFGDELVLVLRHDDEPFRGFHAGIVHYHWHFFCVKKPGKKFDLHPGFVARSTKDISRKERKKMSDDEIKDAMKKGKNAYRKAMSAFQDQFFHELAKFHGLRRMGPMRIRLPRNEQVEYEELIDKGIAALKDSRAQSNEIIAEAENIAKNITVSAEKTADKKIKDAEKKATEIATKLDEREKELSQREIEIEKKAKRYNKFFTRVEKVQKKTIRLIQNKLSESELGRGILNWIWPKYTEAQQIQTTHTKTSEKEPILKSVSGTTHK